MTASPVPAKLRQMVIERAEYCCDRCGIYLPGRQYSLQHRRARGAGGRKDAHSPAGLIVLCGSAVTGCHGYIEQTGPGRSEGYALGFAIRGEITKPEETPIYRHLRSWVIPGDGVWIPSEPINEVDAA